MELRSRVDALSPAKTTSLAHLAHQPSPSQTLLAGHVAGELLESVGLRLSRHMNPLLISEGAEDRMCELVVQKRREFQVV